MNNKQAFLDHLREHPDDQTAMLVFADWLDERGETYEALNMRVRAGVSRKLFKLRDKKTGAFVGKVKGWPTLSAIRAYSNRLSKGLEIVLFELRLVEFCVLPAKSGESL